MAISTLDPQLIESLQQSTREILETMVFMEPRSITAEAEDTSSFNDSVIGLLGFTGTRSGTFVVRTSEELAKGVAAKMMMMEPAEMSSFDEAADAYGEVVNMLAGSFKTAWVAQGNRMDLSVPNVIYRGRVKVQSEADGCLRSRLRVALDMGSLDIGVHFEAKD